MRNYITANQKELIKFELLNRDNRTSDEIGAKLNLPSYIIRQYAVKFNLKFGHFTSFKQANSIIISKELDEIITGSLLGDGMMSNYKYTDNSATNRNSKLAINHSIKQKDYVDFKKELIERNCKCYIKSYLKIDNRPKWKDSISYEVETLQNNSFNKYRDIWYPKGVKIIPKTLTKLTPLIMAIWFQDDGYRCESSGYVLCTNGFTINDVEYLISILETQYNLKCVLRLSSKHHPMIYIRSESVIEFNDLIMPFMCKSMMYKIIVRNKSDKLLENQEIDNQQPIISLND